ncbi:lysine-sensitive aspartokinase 3 [Saccharicrinis fermentans DSM 9555 = JCM 21142]|uniref:Aspartokinase n=1 Tax=Saccharicrinis fermentans DSM 9555 = JCM 21142 TaxID=869213 RepID=W7YDC6_9BACT|nr:lysine-sensitive aspartokinase 3 [Saccharicrinis fermentans DSM 9555 = JCM 21142]
MVVVVSAMGKTTNAMEKLTEAFVQQNPVQMKTSFEAIFDYHNQIVRKLFEKDDPFMSKFDQLLKTLWERVQLNPGLNYDFEYDQIVSFGEIISTHIVSAYANSIGIANQWLDVRHLIKTDESYRDANVNWDLSSQFVHDNIDFKQQQVYITQGFIGSTINNITTTLGREGSDYSGAVLAHVLNADSLSIWKDVPGVLNADPRWYPFAQKLKEISYSEAVELAYYGAQVIHPKTLKPLQNKNIPLFVKSFLDEELEGTVIRTEESGELDVPVYILKQDQLFITISPKDFSFILEDNLSDIFAIFSRNRIKINLMQNSALNFTVCVNNVRDISKLISDLQKDFVVKYNEQVELLTIRNYTDASIQEMIQGKEVVDSQLSRKTARFVVKESAWLFH